MLYDKKNILMLNYEFPPLGGGASPISYNIAKCLVKRGHRVTVVTMHYRGLPIYEEKDGIKTHRIKCLRKKVEICTPFEQLTYLISGYFFLIRHLKNNKYDVCHTHFIIPTGILSAIIKKKFQLKFVLSSHGSDVPTFNPDRFTFLHKFTGPILRYVCREAELIISPSRYLAGLISENIGNFKIEVIPNWIDQKNLNYSDKKRTIISTGRLLPRKGFQYVVKAFKKAGLRDYELHICGDGPMLKELTDLAGSWLNDKIFFHGWMNNKSEEFKKILKSASIFALMSTKENSPMSILEAMNAGCAIITSNTTGCLEMVGNSGITLNSNDIEGIKKSFQELAGNSSFLKSMQEKSRKKIERNYNQIDIMKRYEKILANL